MTYHSQTGMPVMPKRYDDLPDLHPNAQPASMGHIQVEREKFENEIKQLKDPTYRKGFLTPAPPYGYQEHETDSKDVKTLGQELNKRLEYVSRSEAEWQVQSVAFQETISRRKQDETDYQSRLKAAIEAGEEVPEPIEHEDLAPLHKELNKLENAITVGTTVAHESRAKLDQAYQDLYSSAVYRTWAEKEMEQRTKDAVKALGLLRDALNARDAVVGKLPDAFADINGVEFVSVAQRRNSLGFGGMDPYASDNPSFSLADALAKVESATIPGDGIRKWSKSQLDESEKENYADRAARAEVERNDTRTPEEKRETAKQAAHDASYFGYLDNGGTLK
ncbi:hypothetical protein ACYSUO_25695 [Streptomyces sp. UC4497]